MSGDWYHQHFGIGREGLRITAWHGPNNQRSRKPGLPGEQLMDYGAIDLGKGGSAIPYHQEDPAIRKEFQEALSRAGVASRMNPEFYERPPADGEGGMGDVMHRDAARSSRRPVVDALAERAIDAGRLLVQLARLAQLIGEQPRRGERAQAACQGLGVAGRTHQHERLAQQALAVLDIV